MADRSYYWCPTCEKAGMKVELFRNNPEAHLFRDASNHAFTYEQLTQLNASKIPLTFQEKPGDHDVKADFWINDQVLNRYRQKFPVQANSTLNSILAIIVDDDFILLSGEQSRDLKKLGVKTGADMIATARQNQTLSAENADLVSKLDFFSRMMRGAGIEEEVV